MPPRLPITLPVRLTVRELQFRQFHARFNGPKIRPLRPRVSPTSPSRRLAGTFAGNAAELFRTNPVTTSLAFICILGGAASLVYVNIFYQTYIIGAFHKYPEPVAIKLRRALYYTNYDVQPQEALKYYKEALQEAKELRMESFGDEVIGIRIQVAALMEKISQWPRAIEVLEHIRLDNLMWLEKFEGQEQFKRQRTKLLAKTVAISLKLGELYAHPAIFDRDTAEERIVWAVETALREQQRRQAANVRTEDEGEWLSREELGATLESLAHTYEASDQHYLATPLFLRALSLYPATDCHAVVLMNNVASSLAQQNPRAARVAQAYAESRDITARPVGPAASKAALVADAKTWAEKALAAAAAVRPPARTAECDEGCVVATHNLGEFAEMSADVEGARRRYEEAVSLARAIGFQEGVEMSSARLRELR